VAEFEALAQDNSVLAGLVMFVEHGGRVYQAIGYGPRSRWRSHADEVERSFSSFRPLTDPALLAERPARIELVTLPSAMTVEEFVGRYPSTIPAEQVALINGVPTGSTLEAGRIAKRVVEGR
jgi:predicted Zn-dependent protease